MDALLLHKQHHEKKVWLEVAAFPRITMVIKGFEEDIKHKAAILEEEVRDLILEIKI